MKNCKAIIRFGDDYGDNGWNINLTSSESHKEANMRKVKKDLTELKVEEQLTGWHIGVCYQRDTVERYEDIRVDTKERAEEVAHEIRKTGYFKLEKDERKFFIIRNIEDIVSIIICPLTREIFVK